VEAVARRIGALTGARRWGLALLLGALTALVQAPVSQPWVLVLTLPGLFWLLDGARGARGGLAVGWWAGTGYFGAALFWIVEPFLVDVERHGWMAPFALVLMAGGLALFWAAAFGLARPLWRPGAARVWLLAAAWTLAEYARTHVLTGFPWALIGYGWVETPVIQTASVFGMHVLGFLTVGLLMLPAAAGGRGLALAAAVVAAGWAWGTWRLALPVPAREVPFVVRIVQPNAEQHLKWDAAMQTLFWQRHLEATAAPAARRPDVVIWSETAVPFVLSYADDLQAEAAAAAGPEGRLILGIRRLEATAEDERWFNSLAILGPDGTPQAVYDKHHLVPFGEYIPFAEVIARLGLPALTTLTRGGFSAGDGPHLTGAPGIPPFLPLICYEAIFPHLLRAPEGRAEWLVQVTNDAWFGEVAGPHQHFAQARVRAIEQGLPLARAANTGISAMVDPFGRVTERLDLGQAGHFDAVLPGSLPPTPYARWGDLPGVLAMLAIFGLTVANFSSGIFARTRR
jgi:apolipoprotein N-acyltransferase